MLDFTIELHRTNELLERIAMALEMIAGPVKEFPATKPRGPEAIVCYGADKAWMREQFSNLIHETGVAPAQEQEILDQAMARYVEEAGDAPEEEG